ncbi:Serine/threonine protein kinase [Cyclonatronum proteinivorum]|uniref:non-specific serine/threonine protein kinase n=1 Tax=Cyclonatronum proteinivorum TaxID=1457365 RepID=A0A345UHJ0_9BACT|nr:serine/threonine-protein kinase [Cyclonatronum proteinivorum]AXI99941.1 Serine/threonine protein kinase [Cyclonatronum proteinivorum]
MVNLLINIAIAFLLLSAETREVLIQTETGALVSVNGVVAQEVGVGVYRVAFAENSEAGRVIEVFVEKPGFIPKHMTFPASQSLDNGGVLEKNIILNPAFASNVNKQNEWYFILGMLFVLFACVLVFLYFYSGVNSLSVQKLINKKKFTSKEKYIEEDPNVFNEENEDNSKQLTQEESEESDIRAEEPNVVDDSQYHHKYMPKEWVSDDQEKDVASKSIILDGKNFLVLKHLAKGGVADLFLVQDMNGNQLVLKQMSQFLDDDDMRKKFIGEGFAVKRINQHTPNAPIVEIFNYGQMINDSGETVPFILMEYLKGANLTNIIKENRLSFHDKIVISIQLMDAIDAVHSTGVLHRDIAPDNIMVTEEDTPKIKLIDFGVAKHDVAWLSGSSYGALYGKPAYMSPEYLEGTTELDYRSDYYALGVLMYELFSGSLPFKDKNPYAIAEMHRFKEVPKLESVPDKITDIIYMLLEKKPGQRPNSLHEIKLTLKNMINYEY